MVWEKKRKAKRKQKWILAPHDGWDDKYNDYVSATVGGKVRLFKAKKTSIGQTPSIGSEYWEIADTCSKTLTGCKKRFGFNPLSVGTASSTGSTATDTRVILPFGGFPGAKNFR